MKAETPITNLFASWCNSYREDILKPFTRDGYVYATDLHRLIRCKIADYDGDACSGTVNGGSLFDSDIDYHQVHLDIPHIESLMTEDEMSKEVTRECNECNGHGCVEWEYKGYTNDFDCPECNGRGRFVISPSVKTGRKIFDSGDTVNVFGVALNANLFAALRDVLAVTQSPICIGAHCGRIYFRSGIIEGVIMSTVSLETPLLEIKKEPNP